MIKSCNNKFSILSLNIRGQTKLTLQKQLQIQDLIKLYKSDIVHLQETDIDENSFKSCNFIINNFAIISNNSPTGYGTTSLVRNNLEVSNVKLDTLGRIIVFDILNSTHCNVYLEAGTDSTSRSARENYIGEVLPKLLVNRCHIGYICGDWNCLSDVRDATHHANSKLSKNLKKLLKVFEWKDSHRVLFPNSSDFSHYYTSGSINGATRIDRQYVWGNVTVSKSEYFSLAFSDHYGLITCVSAPIALTRQTLPRGCQNFKIRNEVALDPVFHDRVKNAMKNWIIIRENGLESLTWWELVVKPGIRRIGIERSKELNKENRGILNLLLIKQAYFTKRMGADINNIEAQANLKHVQSLICEWYEDKSKKIQDQSRAQEFLSSESTRVYHHELHKQSIKRSSILKLETEIGILEGHEKCAEYLESKVHELLDSPAALDESAQSELLKFVEKVFTDEDNEMLEKEPSKQELYETLMASNLKSAAGSDGIPGLVYKKCWDFLGDILIDVVKEIFRGSPPTVSMRTAMMNFCSKPKKPNSIKPSDKRRISVLNCDFKLCEGLIARRFRKLGSRVLSPYQYVAGNDKTIHHGIARARDAIHAAAKKGLRCGIGDLDYVAAFDYLTLSWVWMVLEQKGVRRATTMRLQNLFKNGLTVPVINSLTRRAILDCRGALRQGGCGSMEWFSFGIDPLLLYLDKNLTGIPIISLPVLGPVVDGDAFPLMPLEERFKVMAYCDDVKPAICSIHEFTVVDDGAALFEKAAGTRLHRDPNSDKCKFLPLGKWRQELKQDDVPPAYMKLTDTLDMVGVKLCATWSTTRTKNGNILKEKVQKLIGSWRSGKFMCLNQRPLSANTYALSLIWFRSSTVNLREGDYAALNSTLKSWIYSDLLFKPEEMVLFRPMSQGGLGLSSVKLKSLACLIRTFIEMAANPKYQTSLYENMLYNIYVLGDDSYSGMLTQPPFYTSSFFNVIKEARASGLCVATMTIRQWYNHLLKQELSYQDGDTRLMKPCRAERMYPNAQWDVIWKNVHLKVVPSDVISFSFKLVHGLLPTEARLNSTLRNVSAACKFSCPGDPPADLNHCFFSCDLTADVGMLLFRVSQCFKPGICVNDILRLEIVDNAALVWVVMKSLYFIWEHRVAKKRVNRTKWMADLVADQEIMLSSHYNSFAIEIGKIIDVLLQYQI